LHHTTGRRDIGNPGLVGAVGVGGAALTACAARCWSRACRNRVSRWPGQPVTGARC